MLLYQLVDIFTLIIILIQFTTVDNSKGGSKFRAILTNLLKQGT